MDWCRLGDKPLTEPMMLSLDAGLANGTLYA